MTIKQFAELVQKQYFERLNEEYPKPVADKPDFWLKDSVHTIKPGRKYTKVDVGHSGKYMIVNDTGEIFGIKAYGVIHRGKRYGTLETVQEWYWGEYSPTTKPNYQIHRQTNIHRQFSWHLPSNGTNVL